MQDPYLILEIAENANDQQVRQAYMRKVREFPPEHCPEQFQAVAAAYEAVKDEIRRARLRLFGLVNAPQPVAEFAPPSRNQRCRIGVQRWLNALKETNDA